ncbi:hypothetical protein D3C78_1883030 [compost metagenome]
MKIVVRPLDRSKGERWQVCLDRQTVNFRNEKEARHFVATLEARLQAPHQLPRLESELRP